MTEQSEWVGVTEACMLLGISNMTIYKLVHDGILPAYRIRGVKAMQFKRQDVLGLIERIEPQSTGERKASRKPQDRRQR